MTAQTEAVSCVSKICAVPASFVAGLDVAQDLDAAAVVDVGGCVGATCPFSRLKSFTRKPSSNFRMCWETPDWVVCSRTAAAVNELSS
jgi:hypothetical protein